MELTAKLSKVTSVLLLLTCDFLSQVTSHGTCMVDKLQLDCVGLTEGHFRTSFDQTSHSPSSATLAGKSILALLFLLTD